MKDDREKPGSDDITDSAARTKERPGKPPPDDKKPKEPDQPKTGTGKPKKEPDKASTPAKSDADTKSSHPAKASDGSPRPLRMKRFPHQPAGDSKQLPGTLENFKYLLKGYEITVTYDVISKQLRCSVPGLSGCPDNAENAAITHIHSLAALNRLPTGVVVMYLEAIANQNQVNPVMDYIRLVPWDGQDRLNDLCKTLKTVPGFPKKLKKKLIIKWLKSAVAAAAMPGGFRTKGVLVLQGPQSIGKTAWVLVLIDDPLLRSLVIKIDHHLDPGNKDSVTTAISHWIVEVGELDSSFKKDIARLKGFITSDQDKVRRPYGRKDSVYSRRTVFIATVNHANFLVDDTGNSRWWAIPLESVDYNHGINMQQLWAQVYHLYQEDKEWWLTPEEERELEVQNAKHRAVNSIREIVYAGLDMDIPKADRVLMSASEVLKALGVSNPSNAQSRDCGMALRELFGEPKTTQGIGRWKVPLKDARGILDL